MSHHMLSTAKVSQGSTQAIFLFFVVSVLLSEHETTTDYSCLECHLIPPQQPPVPPCEQFRRLLNYQRGKIHVWTAIVIEISQSPQQSVVCLQTTGAKRAMHVPCYSAQHAVNSGTLLACSPLLALQTRHPPSIYSSLALWILCVIGVSLFIIQYTTQATQESIVIHNMVRRGVGVRVCVCASQSLPSNIYRSAAVSLDEITNLYLSELYHSCVNLSCNLFSYFLYLS